MRGEKEVRRMKIRNYTEVRSADQEVIRMTGDGSSLNIEEFRQDGELRHFAVDRARHKE